VIYGDVIVWEDSRNGNSDIFAYDLSTGTETQITTNMARQEAPAIYGDVIVWQDFRNSGGDDDESPGDIYALVCTTEVDLAAALDALIADVEALGPDGTGALNSGQSGALTRKLDQVQRLLDRGQDQKAVAVLSDFRRQVLDLEAEGVLGGGEAAALVAEAEAIIGLIGAA
jgi:beta propeller repeat protein